MDINKYILSRTNNYTIHFLNKTKLSVEQIRNIFSEFGNVTNVNTSGNITGMRFVSYATLKETVNCVKNLSKNHKDIKLLPERKQPNDRNNTDISPENTRETNKKCSKIVSKNDISSNRRSKNEDDVPKCKAEVTKELLNNGSIKNEKIFDKEMKLCDEPDNSKSFSYNECLNKSFEILNINSKFAKLVKHSPTYSERSFQKDNGKDNDEIPSLISSRTSIHGKSIESLNEIPGLISSRTSIHGKSIESLNEIRPSSCSIKELKIILAQDVVVANMHKDVSVHFILDLFEEFDPIAVSLIKTIPRSEIRYCHVYFKNIQDACMVEDVFDKFPIFDQELIVLRFNKLLDEVLTL